MGDGAATISAALNGIASSATINVFQPNPSPASPLTQSVAYQIDPAHSGQVVFGTPLSFPNSPSWVANFPGAVFYPLIAGGYVYVTATNTNGSTSLYALNESTGATAWGPITLPGTLSRSMISYDHGTLFVVTGEGIVKSFSASTGAAGWSIQLPNENFVIAPPTAGNGVVYISGNGNHMLYAVDESNGNLLWKVQDNGADSSTPAISDDGVFISHACDVQKLNPITGAVLWQYAAQCSGATQGAPVYANGFLYSVSADSGVPNSLIFNASSGSETGSFLALVPPAITAQTGYFNSLGTLTAINSSNSSVLWTFTGDGHLTTSPIVLNQAVVVLASTTGNVFAVDTSTGAQLWSGMVGTNAGIGSSLGISAGENYLVVPAGNTLTAWHIGP